MVLAAGLVSALGVGPAAAWSSTFSVASMSVRYGSGVVQQTITLSDSVVGSRGDLVVTTNSDSSGLVTGMNVSSSTHATCIQVGNNGSQIDWYCESRSWGAGTFAVLINTGSSTESFPPGTGNDPNAVTTSISDSSNRLLASGTVGLLAPATPTPTTAPPTHASTPPAPKPSKASASASPTPTGTPSSTTLPSSTASASPSAFGSPSTGIVGAIPSGPPNPPESFDTASGGGRSSAATTDFVIGAALLALGLVLIRPVRRRRRAVNTLPPWDER